MKISVIVPVYNIEPYLSLCVDSILSQKYTDFELLLIDDGSTDGSGAICDEYAKRDGRVRVFRKKNGGVSEARNLGMDVATGDYLTFVDGDDVVADDYIETLIELAESSHADITACWFMPFSTLESPRQESTNDTDIKMFNRSEALESLLYQKDVPAAPFGKLFERKVVDRLRFDETITYAEDLDFTFKALSLSANVSVTKYKGYYYRLRPGSAMLSGFRRQRLAGMKVVKKIIDECGLSYPASLSAAVNRQFMEAVYILIAMPFFSSDYSKERVELWDMIVKLRADVLKDSKNTLLSSKLYALVSYCGYVIFKIFHKMKELIMSAIRFIL